MNDRELLQQALDSLEWAERRYSYANLDLFNKPIEAIRTRLAQPEPEAVADKYLMEVECTKCGAKQDGILTVTAPPKKEWVGLTDDDINRFVDAIYKGLDMKPRNEIEIQYFERLIKFIDRKLKEKNGD